MPFTEEIRQAAENLGKRLGADPGVQEYVDLKEKIQQDAEVVGLENKFVKAIFAQTAQRISSVLGIEYPAFANQPEE